MKTHRSSIMMKVVKNEFLGDSLGKTQLWMMVGMVSVCLPISLTS